MRKLVLIGLALSLTACSNREVTDLKAQVAALQAQVQALQAENAALQAQVNAAGSALGAANDTALKRAALAYGQNVYKAAYAAMAEDPTYTADKLAAEHATCMGGVTIKAYSVPSGPANIESCTIRASGQDVVVTVRTATDTFTTPQ